MKRWTLFAIGILFVTSIAIFGQSARDLFNQALIQERAAGNLDQAIQLYQRVASQSSDRAIAAQGLLGAARSYQKMGEVAKSKDLYAMVVKTYPELQQEVAIAKENLSDSGTVQGRLTRASTGEPIADAKVALTEGPLIPEMFEFVQQFLD